MVESEGQEFWQERPNENLNLEKILDFAEERAIEIIKDQVIIIRENESVEMELLRQKWWRNRL